ncbi:hypothetical protein ASG52_16195 [Methylobacterium sp. Leaf456]|uniref:hypothetical protein n=1 Tax=Methylobacterium sp. Leaf456 TaxID=1736382 RepID=UPI0006F8D182|nr:hypothetical protein [Methylobacterium sp. Leaf456]KQT60796.1 hypothetical protein ASG52_16195 [Methylobacterium sp. Leaf456]
MHPYRYRIGLRIRHPELVASVICAELLPLVPRRVWDVGAPRTAPNGRPLGGVNEETYATFFVSKGEGDLAEALTEAAERMEPYRQHFAAWRASGGDIEFFVGWFMEGSNVGDVFAPELLAQLGGLGIALSLDLYERAERG